jgi:hypothetical protein
MLQSILFWTLIGFGLALFAVTAWIFCLIIRSSSGGTAAFSTNTLLVLFVLWSAWLAALYIV